MKVRHIATRTVEQQYSYIYSPTVWGFPKAPWTRNGERMRVPTMEDIFGETFARVMYEARMSMVNNAVSYNTGSSWRLTNG